MKLMCPSADEAMARWWGERCRAAASPGAITALMEMNSRIDVRALLPAIRVPTLVVHRGTDYDVRVEEGRYIAERIPGARFVELPGADHFVAIDPDQILDAVEPFLDRNAARRRARPRARDAALHRHRRLDGRRPARRPAWRDLVERHHGSCARAGRFRGRELDTRGDGFLATSTARRARSAARARSRARVARARSRGPRRRAHGRGRAADGDGRAASPSHRRARRGAAAAPARCSCRRRSTTSSPAPGSNSPTAATGARGVPGEWRLLAVVDADRGRTDASPEPPPGSSPCRS